MKILANLTALVKKTDANLPFGKTIQDETDTQPGTPIVADLMQDLFSNFYRLLELAKITPTNEFDGDSTQYQLIDALKKLPNSMNDIEQVLTLDGSIWSVSLDLSILPNKYFFFARASDNYIQDVDVPSPDYTFKGTGTDEYTFTSDNFNSGDELLIVIDTGGVRAYPLKPVPTKKRFKALLTQVSSGAPTSIILENNLGEITFSRNLAGVYTITSDNLFTEDKTAVSIENGTSQNEEGINNIYRTSESQITLITMNLDLQGTSDTYKSDDMLYRTLLEIEVYN